MAENDSSSETPAEIERTEGPNSRVNAPEADINDNNLDKLSDMSSESESLEEEHIKLLGILTEWLERSRQAREAEGSENEIPVLEEELWKEPDGSGR